MEIKISKKWLGNPTMWLGVLCVFLLLLNVVQFFKPARVTPVVEIKEVNNTAYLNCPGSDLKKSDVDDMLDSCLSKVDSILKQQKELMTPNKNSTCKTTLSTKEKAALDDPILASDCYKKQLPDVPTGFSKYLGMDIDKVCGDEIYGVITIRLDDTLKGETIREWEIPFEYKNKKVTCNEMATFDFEGYQN